MQLVQMLIVCESCLYSLQICIRIWYNTIIKTAIKCDILCKIKSCNCRLLLRTTYYAPVAELAYAADSNSVFLRQQIEQIVSKSKTPAKVFRDSRVVYMYTIGLDTDQGTLRELTADELPDADRLPDGEYV